MAASRGECSWQCLRRRNRGSEIMVNATRPRSGLAITYPLVSLTGMHSSIRQSRIAFP